MNEVFVCPLTDQPPVNTSTIKRCAECARRVWWDAHGYAMAGGKPTVMCPKCAEKRNP